MTEKPSVAATREDIYRLLAACYYPPTAALLKELSCAGLAEMLNSAAPDAVEPARQMASYCSASMPEEQLVEYSRLFLGPFKLVAPPYGSVWLDASKIVMGASTARVAAFYDNCGLRLADDFHELPDHIAVELEFMSFLAFKGREAAMAGDNIEAGRLSAVQQEFLDNFLLPWLGQFTASIVEDGESPLYQAIAHCTSAFVTEDMARLLSLSHV
ncbi:MAG: molecular chaperone TorD family protein [Geobacteraceae bacterium]|nr:molecular chaperone TorD family protein [Geobacteraceae bacterium]NTW78899.1 molecular chaperone TorD family protein [Geobacteraceae bacterium]